MKFYACFKLRFVFFFENLKIADEITSSNDEDGVARGIKKSPLICGDQSFQGFLLGNKA